MQQLNFVYHNLLQGSLVITIGFRPLDVDLKVSKSITPIELDTVNTFIICLFIGNSHYCCYFYLEIQDLKG